MPLQPKKQSKLTKIVTLGNFCSKNRTQNMPFSHENKSKLTWRFWATFFLVLGDFLLKPSGHPGHSRIIADSWCKYTQVGRRQVQVSTFLTETKVQLHNKIKEKSSANKNESKCLRMQLGIKFWRNWLRTKEETQTEKKLGKIRTLRSRRER